MAEKLPRLRRHPESRLLVGAGVGLLLLGVLIGRWMVTPFDDWVPLVAPADFPADVDPNELPQSAHFRCSAPFWDGGSAVATEQATDALELQDLTREPCVDTRGQHRAVAIVDLVVTSGALLLVVREIQQRRRVAGESTEPGTPTASAVA